VLGGVGRVDYWVCVAMRVMIHTGGCICCLDDCRHNGTRARPRSERHVAPSTLHIILHTSHVSWLTRRIAAHVSAARSLMLMRQNPPQNGSLRRDIRHHYDQRYEHQQQQQQQPEAIDHVNRVMEWSTRVGITPTPSLRCDALQVLSAAEKGGGGHDRGAGVEAVRSLVEMWRSKGIKLGEKEYVAAILSECNALSRRRHIHGHHRDHHTHNDFLGRLEHIVSCAAADGVQVTTSIMNACLSAATSNAASPPSISSVLRCIPLPAPPPDALTVDIVAASYVSAENESNVDSDDGRGWSSEEQLALLFNRKPISFLSHTLPPPTSSTLVAVVKACIRHGRVPVAVNILRLACITKCDTNCLITAKACKIFSDGLHRGVTAKTYSPSFRDAQMQELMDAVIRAAAHGKLPEEQARVCLQALRGEEMSDFSIALGFDVSFNRNLG
jgi:hypothetical protein